MARKSVCIGGQNMTWCMYCTRFCRWGMVWTLLAACTRGDGFFSVGGVVGSSGNLHKFVAASRPPSSTIASLSHMQHFSLSNVTVYPASQNFAVESSDACVRPGTMWACVAASFSHGMLMLQVWVEVSIAPSGSVMWIGSVSTFLLTTFAPVLRKWLVAPESLSAELWWAVWATE